MAPHLLVLECALFNLIKFGGLPMVNLVFGLLWFDFTEGKMHDWCQNA